jgi:dienelactone hydrolase
MRDRRLAPAVPILAAVLVLGGCAADEPSAPKSLEPHYRIQRPQTAGPFAAILLVPGCRGVTPARLETAVELVSRGYLVAFVDYLAARGRSGPCASGVSAGDVARDIRAVSAHVRSRSDVRPGAVGVIGWSLGGAGVLASLVGVEFDRQPPFDAAVAFYPVCRGLLPWKTNVPTLLLLAGRDVIAPPAHCEDVVLRSAGRVQIHTFAGARHAFDTPDDLDAEAAREAWSEALMHFKTRLP